MTPPPPPLAGMGYNVSQAKITAQIRALAKPFKPAVGSTDTRPVSLLDLGYARAGLDDGWQNCGAGINGSVSHQLAPLPRSSCGAAVA